MDESKLMELMDVAVNRFASQGYQLDDVRWGKDAFAFDVYDKDAVMLDTAIETFYFRYDPDDVFERTAEQQLEDKLNEYKI